MLVTGSRGAQGALLSLGHWIVQKEPLFCVAADILALGLSVLTPAHRLLPISFAALCQLTSPHPLLSFPRHPFHHLTSLFRYIFYYEKMLRTDRILLSTFRLVHVKMITIPSFNASLVHSGCSPYLEIYLDGHRNVHSGSPQHCLTRVHSAVEFTPNVLIRGDVCVSVHSEGVKMAQVVFNTSFVDNGYLLFARDVVDMVPKDFNTFAEGFAIELTMERASDLPELNAELSEEVTAEPTMINDYEQEEQ